MTPGKRLFTTALLDLICCGLGAATVLWILSASWLPQETAPARSPSLIVRCRKSPESPPAEIGIECRPPNQTHWVSVFPTDIKFSAESDSSSGGEAFLILQNPTPGYWQFRPYLRDFPAQGSKVNQPVKVTLHLWGAHRAISQMDLSARMRLPGEHGPAVNVMIPPPGSGE